MAKLPPNLKAFADDPLIGGSPGHLAIAPVNANGQIDLQLLQEWADTIDDDQPHPLTNALQSAIVENDAKGTK